MQRSGLDWLWRIKEEPVLWRRYFRDGRALLTLFVTRVFPYAWYLHLHKPDADQLATANAEAWEEGPYCIVHLRGAWTQWNIAPVRECLSKVALSERVVRLEMSGVTYVDGAVIGLVVLLQGHQKQHGRQFLIVSPPQPVFRVIK